MARVEFKRFEIEQYVPKSQYAWNVMVEDFNARKIVMMNILDNINVVTGIYRNVISDSADEKTFKEDMQSWLSYAYWSKSEYEVYVSGFRVEEAKIDVYDQLCANMTLVLDYLWINRKGILNERIRTDEDILFHATRDYHNLSDDERAQILKQYHEKMD